jgi:hypothetical protein
MISAADFAVVGRQLTFNNRHVPGVRQLIQISRRKFWDAESRKGRSHSDETRGSGNEQAPA